MAGNSKKYLLIDALRKELGEEYNVDTVKVEKNNGTKEGITVRRKGEHVGPVFYPDLTNKKKTFKVLAREILESLPSLMEGVKEAPLLSEYNDSIKERLFMKAVNYGWNKEALEEKPHLRKVDLAGVAAIDISDFFGGEEGTASTDITNGIIHIWNVDADTVLKRAVANIENKSHICGVMEKMAEMMDVPKEVLPPTPLMVLMRKDSEKWCAGLIFSEKVLKDIEEKVGSYYILPSSVHELLILPEKEAPVLPGELVRMVKDINEGEVLPEERLSDNVYYYSDGELHLIAEPEEEPGEEHEEELREEGA